MTKPVSVLSLSQLLPKLNCCVPFGTQRVETKGLIKNGQRHWNESQGRRLPSRYWWGAIVLNLRDLIRTGVSIIPPRLLVHDVISYGVPICAFMGMPRPAAAGTSRISNVLVGLRALLSALILMKHDLTNSPNPARALQGRPNSSAFKKKSESIAQRWPNPSWCCCWVNCVQNHIFAV